MTQETKSFFQKYWQAILIAVSINVVIGIITNVGAYAVVLYKVEQSQKKNITQDQSIFELQMNQQIISAKENIKLPYKLTASRGF